MEKAALPAECPGITRWRESVALGRATVQVRGILYRQTANADDVLWCPVLAGDCGPRESSGWPAEASQAELAGDEGQWPRNAKRCGECAMLIEG